MTPDEIRKFINDKHGRNTVVTNTVSIIEPENIIPTGSVGLDIALGIGGLPRGRMVEIIGQESSGKTTLALHIIAEAQKKNIVCAVIDAEHALDGYYASKIGVKMDDIILSQPDYGEQALVIVDSLLDTSSVGVIVIDSVAALVPKAELDGDFGASNVGLHARMMSQAMRKLVGKIAKANCLVIWINQYRDKVGVMFGNPQVPTGGNALKFYASIRLDVSRSTTAVNSLTDENGEKSGNLTTIKVLKNKLAPPFKATSFYIKYGVGIDKLREVFDLALKYQIIIKDKRTYYIGEQKIGSLEDTVNFLSDNPELTEKIYELSLPKV